MKLRTLLMAATALTGFTAVAHAGDISFAAVPFAADDAAKRVVVAAAAATVDGVEVPLAFHTIARSGDMLGDVAFGQLLTLEGKPIAGAISNNPDFTSLLPKNGKLYSVTQFEDAPAALMLTELAQDADGNLKPVSSKPIDTSTVWAGCGSLAPVPSPHGAPIWVPRNTPITPASPKTPRKSKTFRKTRCRLRAFRSGPGHDDAGSVPCRLQPLHLWLCHRSVGV